MARQDQTTDAHGQRWRVGPMGAAEPDDVDPLVRQVERIMRDRGLTQVELAERAGVAQPHLSRWLAGGRSPSLKSMRRLADALGIDYEVVERKRKDER